MGHLDGPGGEGKDAEARRWRVASGYPTGLFRGWADLDPSSRTPHLAEELQPSGLECLLDLGETLGPEGGVASSSASVIRARSPRVNSPNLLWVRVPISPASYSSDMVICRGLTSATSTGEHSGATGAVGTAATCSPAVGQSSSKATTSGCVSAPTRSSRIKRTASRQWCSSRRCFPHPPVITRSEQR